MTYTMSISARGQVTLPAPLRTLFKFADGGQAIVEATEEGILIKPAPLIEERLAEINSWVRRANVPPVMDIDEAIRQYYLEREQR